MARLRVRELVHSTNSSMTNKFSFLFVARKSRVANHSVLQVRVTINNKRCDVCSTGIKCLTKNWNAASQTIRGNAPENKMLDIIKSDAFNIYYDFEVKKKSSPLKFSRSYLREMR